MSEDQLKYGLKVIQKLVTLGIDDVPTITAVGAQNTGKSTTLNRLANINIFPARRQGDAYNAALTCAQIVVTTRPGDHWHGRLSHGDQTTEGGFDTQEALETCICEFLREQQETSKYKDKSSGFITQPIYVSVMGPDLMNVHFIDNPGMTTADRAKFEMAREMSVSSVRGRKNTIVLFFLNAADDPVNSPAWFAVQEARGPVMIVVTKPDCAPAGGKGVFELMTTGVRGIPGNRAYIVKGPDTGSGDSKWTQDDEMNYFHSSSGFIKSAAERFPDKIGITNLRRAAMAELIEIYARNKAELRTTVTRMIHEQMQKKNALGEEIDDLTRSTHYDRCVELFIQNVIVASKGKHARRAATDNIYADAHAYIQVARERLLAIIASPVVSMYDDRIWTKMREVVSDLMDTRYVTTMVDGYLETQLDSGLHDADHRLETRVMEARKFVSKMVQKLFVQKVANGIKERLTKNAELVQFVCNSEENVRARREAEVMLRDLQEAYDMLK